MLPFSVWSKWRERKKRNRFLFNFLYLSQHNLSDICLKWFRSMLCPLCFIEFLLYNLKPHWTGQKIYGFYPFYSVSFNEIYSKIKPYRIFSIRNYKTINQTDSMEWEGYKECAKPVAKKRWIIQKMVRCFFRSLKWLISKMSKYFILVDCETEWGTKSERVKDWAR